MADPYFANVKLLLALKGANGGTVFTDQSPVGRSVSYYGNVQTVTNQSRYYGSSAYFDGSNDYLRVEDSADWYFATGTFTIEAWIRPQTTANTIEGIVAQRSSSTNEHAWSLWVHASTGTLGFEANDNAFQHYSASGVITYGAWQHIAACYDGTTMRTFVNGTVVKETTVALNVANEVQQVLVGRASSALSNTDFKGHMNDVRITKGVARYTANFTPPGPLVDYYSPLVVKGYNGAAWAEGAVKNWNGASWEASVIRRYDGLGWPIAS